MFNKTSIFYAYYGLVGAKQIYKHFKNNVKNDKIDDIIDKAISNNKSIDNNDKKYSINKIKINRKIPDQKELKEIYTNFVNSNKNINKISESDVYYYTDSTNDLYIVENDFLFFTLNLEGKFYFKLVIDISLKNINNNTKILFIINNNYKHIEYEFNIDEYSKELNIIFNNIYFENDVNLEILLIFKNFNKNLYLNNFNIKVLKVENKLNKNPIFIVKNNIYKQFLFYSKDIFYSIYNKKINSF